jgi:putative two-component system response regulator
VHVVPAETQVENRPGTQRSSILITDDDDAARSLVVSVLGPQYRYEEASGVGEARQKLSEEEFDLVICDVNPSGQSGWALAEEILAEHRHTSIIFVTAEDDLRLARQAFELGAHGYVVKPYKPGQLLIVTMNALKRRELEIAHERYEQKLQQQLQTVIDNAPLRIFVKDRQRRFIAINVAAARPTGRLPEELIGHTAEEFMPAASAALARAGDLRVLEERETHEAEEEITIGTETTTLLTSKFPLLDEQGQVYAVCAISADLTEIKRSERRLEELLTAQDRSIEELRTSRLESVERLARTVELRDTETGEHVKRMADIAAFLGRVLGLGDAHADLLLVAATMHDIGKVGIPDEILLKPGALTADERREMERHTTVGYELLGDSESAVLRMGAAIALTHHERWDGAGYPHGLVEEAIPLEGRIAAVADVFDALLSDRPYRPAMSLDEALEIMENGRGTHFDPTIVEALLGNLDEVLELRG